MIRPLLLSLALAGCATPYWVQGPHGLVLAVVEVEDTRVACKADVLGCYDPLHSVIYIKAGIRHRQCVLDHEYKHAAGYRHPEGTHPTSYGIDCGDGQMVPH